VLAAQVAEHGLLIVCRAIDLNCIAKAGSAAGPDALRYWDKFEGNGRQGAMAPRMFLFTLLPPANAEILLD